MERHSKLSATLQMVLPLAILLAAVGNSGAAEPPLHVDPRVTDCSIRLAPGLTQAAFGRFVREFGSVSAYKLASQPATIGRHRVAVGIERLDFTVEERADAWNDTFVHPDADHELGSRLLIPKLRVRFGLRDDLDMGAYYSRNFQANYGWVGVDLHYAPIRQSARFPVTLAVRGAYTRTLYAHDLDMHALSSDFVVGRTLWGALTPYIGAGSDLVLARERSSAVQLARETQDVSHWLVGAEYRLGHLALGVEAGRAALATFEVHVTGVF